MLYVHLSYVVRFLASPILWLRILFMSEFALPPDPSNITLDGMVVSHQWLADDAMLASTLAGPAQDKLDYFEQYCGNNSLTPSMPKIYAALYGPIPDPPPVLTLQHKLLTWVDTATYTGVTLSLTVCNIFKPHYAAKETAARKVANGALALEQYIGTIPPPIALRMFHAVVEPHLT
ncbi:hypothetical protein C8T65DRAFT_771434 [Cerioporus squamosus]|nr:hypothetical protein C8T65DRAFT_771434 [Cerioporus squamosus]